MATPAQAAPSLPHPSASVIPAPEQLYATIPQPMSMAPDQPQAAAEQQGAFSSPEKLMDWVTTYRKHPNPSRVPAAVHAMLDYGLLADEEKEWFCIGFIAGVLGTNPKDGPGAHPAHVPDARQGAGGDHQGHRLFGRPDWRELLEKNSSRMPLRRPLIDDFLQASGRR